MSIWAWIGIGFGSVCCSSSAWHLSLGGNLGVFEREGNGGFRVVEKNGDWRWWWWWWREKRVEVRVQREDKAEREVAMVIGKRRVSLSRVSYPIMDG